MADKNTSPTITPEQSELARKDKAEKEKQRREKIKRAKVALNKAGLKLDTDLDAAQRDRAAEAADKKPGLTGKSLAAWIMEGKTTADVVADAKETRQAEAKAEKTKTNVTRSKDPEAAELAVAAKALQPNIKSAFLPKDAREFIDLFQVSASGQTLTIQRTPPSTDPVDIKRVDLRKFGVDGDGNKEVRAALSAVGKGSRLWGRKLALMVLATDAAAK